MFQTHRSAHWLPMVLVSVLMFISGAPCRARHVITNHIRGRNLSPGPAPGNSHSQFAAGNEWGFKRLWNWTIQFPPLPPSTRSEASSGVGAAASRSRTSSSSSSTRLSLHFEGLVLLFRWLSQAALRSYREVKKKWGLNLNKYWDSQQEIENTAAIMEALGCWTLPQFQSVILS